MSSFVTVLVNFPFTVFNELISIQCLRKWQHYSKSLNLVKNPDFKLQWGSNSEFLSKRARNASGSIFSSQKLTQSTAKLKLYKKISFWNFQQQKPKISRSFKLHIFDEKMFVYYLKLFNSYYLQDRNICKMYNLRENPCWLI